MMFLFSVYSLLQHTVRICLYVEHPRESRLEHVIDAYLIIDAVFIDLIYHFALPFVY